MELSPFKIWAAKDGSLVKDGDARAAVLVVAKGLPITKHMRECYDFDALLNPIPEGRSQEEGAPPVPVAEPASAPPAEEEEEEEDPNLVPEEQPGAPPTTRRGQGRKS